MGFVSIDKNLHLSGTPMKLSYAVFLNQILNPLISASLTSKTFVGTSF